MMMASKLEIYRSYELDLSDRIRWLKSDADNLGWVYDQSGKDLNPKLLDNIINLATAIKRNLEVLK